MLQKRSRFIDKTKKCADCRIAADDIFCDNIRVRIRSTHKNAGDSHSKICTNEVECRKKRGWKKGKIKYIK